MTSTTPYRGQPMTFFKHIMRVIGRIMMENNSKESKDLGESSGKQSESEREADPPIGGDRGDRDNNQNDERSSPNNNPPKKDDKSDEQETVANSRQTTSTPTNSNNNKLSNKKDIVDHNVLDNKELNNWAEAAVDEVLNKNEKDVTPSQYDPDRIQKQINEIDPNNVTELRSKIKLSKVVFRRRRAYVDELETRLIKSNERISELTKQHEQEKSQLNSLIDKKENKIDELRKYGPESLAAPIIFKVRQDLIGAVSHDDPDDIQEATEFALADLEEVLENQGIQVLEPDVGTQFDYNKHNSIGRKTDHRPEQTIVSVQQPGFAIEGDVRQKAKVVVSDGTGEPQFENTDRNNNTDDDQLSKTHSVNEDKNKDYHTQ